MALDKCDFVHFYCCRNAVIYIFAPCELSQISLQLDSVLVYWTVMCVSVCVCVWVTK